MQYLRQSTAITLKIGPFVDDTDGNTVEDGLTISQADVRLSKNGGNIAQKNESTACTHDELGVYGCPIDATDTATLGRLQLWVHESGALPVWHEFMVVPANVWDSFFGTDSLEVDTVAVSGDATAADNLELACDNYSATRGLAGTALPAAAADAAGGVPVSDAGDLDMDAMDAQIDDIETDTQDIQGRLPAALVSGRMSSDAVAISGSTAAADAVEANIGNLDASVADVEADTQDLQTQIGTAGAGLTDLGGMSVGMQAEVNAEVDQALADYDPATHAELQSEINDVQVDIAALENISAADVNAEVDTALADYDGPTNAEMEARTLVAAAYFDPAADPVATVTDVTNEVSADVTAVSGDATAADNLESQYDETGLAGDTFPATQAAVANIGAASGGAIHFAAEEDNTGGAVDPSSAAFVGSVQAGTFASTQAEDGTIHDIDDTGDDIDIVYGFSVGGGRTATQVGLAVSVSGNGDEIKVKVYDHDGADWEVIKTLSGTPGVSYQSFDLPLLLKHSSGVGSEIGKTYIRFETDATTPSNLSVDKCLVSAVSTNRTVGYADGAIWVDSAGVAGSENFVNGTADNPCPWANALVIAASLGLDRFHIANDVTITLSAAFEEKTMYGEHYYLALGGQSINDSHITGATITGIASAVDHTLFFDCEIGAATIPPCRMVRCGIGNASGTFAAASDGDYTFIDCYSLVPGSGSPSFAFGGLGAATGINNRRWAGGATWTLDSDCTLSHEVLAGGGTTVTTGGANVEIRGITRSVTLILSGAGTVQFVGTTGPIAISGTATTTVNLYGVSASLADTSVNTTVNDETQPKADIALEDIHLDHLLAADYDPASKPGVATALLNELIEDDSGVSRYTANALEQAPTGGSAPTAEEIVDEWEAQSQADPTGFHVNVMEVGGTAQTASDYGADLATLLTRLSAANAQVLADWIDGGRLDLIIDAILADTNELQSDDVPSLIAALNDLSSADIDAALATYDGPTNAEMIARTLVAAAYFDPASDTVADVTTVATLAGHTPQTGDGFARLGAPAGASVSADIADVPTLAEMNAGHGLLATEAKQDAIDVIVDAILEDTGTTLPGLIAALENLSAADVLTQTAAALVAIHLDHLFAADYDPASKPGIATALLNELVEDDGGVSRYTANALEEAPTGGSAPTAEEIVDEWETQSQADPTGFHVNVMEVGGTAQTANDNSADINAILADTNELQTDDVPGLIAALNDPTAVEIRQEMDNNSTQLAAIVADTDELQGDWANGGRLDVLLDAVKAVTDLLPDGGSLNDLALILADTSELQGDWTDGGRLDLILDAILAAIAALEDLSAAEVNAEMLDVLTVDTFAEPGQGTPPATTTLAVKWAYVYKFLRNRVTSTASQVSVYDDAGAVIDHKSAVSDDATTYDRGEFGSGP